MKSEEHKPILRTMRELAAGRGSPNFVRAYVFGFVTVIAGISGLMIGGAHDLCRIASGNPDISAVPIDVLRLLGGDDESGDPQSKTRQAGNVFILKTTVDGEEYQFYSLSDCAYTYAFPLKGQGFMGEINGWMSVDIKKDRILGICFTRNEETPGLGGRITEKAFCDSFIGKRFLPNRNGRLQLLKSGAKGNPNAVDAITGATQTSMAVERLLNSSIEKFIGALSSVNPPWQANRWRG